MFHSTFSISRKACFFAVIQIDSILFKTRDSLAFPDRILPPQIIGKPYNLRTSPIQMLTGISALKIILLTRHLIKMFEKFPFYVLCTFGLVPFRGNISVCGSLENRRWINAESRACSKKLDNQTAHWSKKVWLKLRGLSMFFTCLPIFIRFRKQFTCIVGEVKKSTTEFYVKIR